MEARTPVFLLMFILVPKRCRNTLPGAGVPVAATTVAGRPPSPRPRPCRTVPRAQVHTGGPRTTAQRPDAGRRLRCGERVGDT